MQLGLRSHKFGAGDKLRGQGREDRDVGYGYGRAEQPLVGHDWQRGDRNMYDGGLQRRDRRAGVEQQIDGGR